MASDTFRQCGIINGLYDQTLDRLGNNKKEPSWWRCIVLTAEGDYILPYKHLDPHFLRIASVRDWLSNCDVRDEFKTLATRKILGDSTDTKVLRQRLAQSYAHYTAEDPSLAAAAIETVQNGLIAGVTSALNPSHRIIVDLIRESNLRINATHAEILRAIQRLQKAVAPELNLETGNLEIRHHCDSSTVPSPILSRSVQRRG
jgi:hypothetical protein